MPSGSVTKPWTAVAVLQQVAAGAVELHTPAHEVVDPALRLACARGTPCSAATMRSLWGGNPQVQLCTRAVLS